MKLLYYFISFVDLQRDCKLTCLKDNRVLKIVLKEEECEALKHFR